MKANILYTLRILKHKWLVLLFGLRVGGVPLCQLLIHDLSKFSREEFAPYRRRFMEGGKPTSEWYRAFRHHWERNPHHWQYWVREEKPEPMPEAYVREMLADWMAANRTYGGVSLQEWLDAKFGRMNLHPETVVILHRIMPAHGLRVPI